MSNIIGTHNNCGGVIFMITPSHYNCCRCGKDITRPLGEVEWKDEDELNDTQVNELKLEHDYLVKREKNN